MLLLLAPFLCATSVLAADTSSDGLGPIGGYVPKLWVAALGMGLYLLSAIWLWSRFFRYGRQRYMLCVCIGMTTLACGFGIRIGQSLMGDKRSMGLYIGMTFFILLSPCAFLAQDYILLQRLARCLPPDVAKRCFLVPAQRVVLIFVTGDVLTFLLQAGGGGMEAMKDAKTVNLGQKIALVGLVLQLVSFGFFTIALIVFGLRLHSTFPSICYGPSFDTKFSQFDEQSGRKWRKLYYTVCVTCVGILIRSVFRCAEFAQGFNGYLTTHEGYFYLLDALPLWAAMSLYGLVWPPVHLGLRDGNDMTEVGLDSV